MTTTDMNDNYREKLKAIALSIYEFQRLNKSDKDKFKPLLSNGAIETLKMLDLIESQRMTFEEIAIEMNCTKDSVKQKLSALKRGGYPVDMDEKSAVALTGRPRKLNILITCPNRNSNCLGC